MSNFLELSEFDIATLIIGLNALGRNDVANCTGQNFNERVESLRSRIAKFADRERRGADTMFALSRKEDVIEGVNMLTPDRDWDWIFQPA